jgi:hypothetical protein
MPARVVTVAFRRIEARRVAVEVQLTIGEAKFLSSAWATRRSRRAEGAAEAAARMISAHALQAERARCGDDGALALNPRADGD